MSAPALLPPTGPAFTRRSLLAAGLAVPVLLTVGCTAEEPAGADAVTPAQVDQLAGQLAVQEQLVTVFDDAFASSPELAAAAAALAVQAREQLDRLRAAAPTAVSSSAATSSASAGGSTPGTTAPVDPVVARATLRAQVAAAATSHATACLDFTGARAALLGSIAAGLRGQDGQLA